MKHHFTHERPACLIEDWPGKYDTFSWLEFGITVPNPIYVVTTLKEGGVPNANLQSWGLLLGEGQYNHYLMAVLKHHHTYANILRTREWCVNYVPQDYIGPCFATIQNNEPETDEIAASGLTAEQPRVIKTPSIAQSAVALECELRWEKTLAEGSRWSLLCGEIVDIAIEERVMVTEPEKRVAAMNLMYNVRGTVNPLNGDYHGPNTVGLLSEVIRHWGE